MACILNTETQSKKRIIQNCFALQEVFTKRAAKLLPDKTMSYMYIYLLLVYWLPMKKFMTFVSASFGLTLLLVGK